ESFTLEANGVDAKTLCLAFGNNLGKGRHVLRNHRRCTDVSVTPNAAELVHGTKRANRREIFHGDMTRKSCAVHKQSVAANHAVMPDMRIGEEKIVVAKSGLAAALLRSTAYGDVFAEN